jgi:hypothetical protein
MIAARTARDIAPIDYEDIIRAVDWNRVLVEARGLHFTMMHAGYDGTNTCGTCIQTVLLRKEY